MEKIKSICVMHNLLKAMAELETQLHSLYELSANEAMTLCCIAHDTLTATGISDKIGLTPSNTSKVLRALENKELIRRAMGEKDRRQMRFSLTESGLQKLQLMKSKEIEIPQYLQPLFQLKDE